MDKFFNLNFSNDLAKLTFKVYQTSIAQKWYQELVTSTNEGGIKEKNRLVNFSNQSKQADLLEINGVITYLNEHWPENAQLLKEESYELLQRRLNDLHKLFEIYRGRINDPPLFFQNATSETRAKLERMNVLIHQLEGIADSPRLVITFEHSPRIELKEDDYQHFTPKMKYGEVYINYCDTGRELIEAFQAKDQVVSDENLRPLRHFSSDFRIYFPEIEAPLLEKKDLSSFNQFISSKGFKVGDPKNSIGRIPVACLSSNIERQELLDLIHKANEVKEVFV